MLEVARVGDDGQEEEEEETPIERPARVTAAQFKFCLESFIQLLTDFSAGHPDSLEFRWII